MTDELTPDEVTRALKIAGELIDAGIPVFAAAPDSSRPGQYHLPKAWEQTRPDRSVLERWRPGWALGAVGGSTADFLDIDPRNGGRESEKELRLQQQFPRSFGQQETPSGGSHHLISATGERKSTNFMPGLDLQSGGRPDQYGKRGRGFVYISPTVRPSKAPETLGQLRPYRWVEAPDTELLADFGGSDDSTEGVIARVYSRRSAPAYPEVRSAGQDPFATPSTAGFGGARTFTVEQMQEHTRPALLALASAPIGDIEARCNDAAAQLSHFVPNFFSVEQGMELLRRQLAPTAYDESHPASQWTVEKFRAVLDGTRPLTDNWKATVATPVDPIAAMADAVEHASGDAVDALCAEMLTLAEVAERPAPRYLIKTLLNLDSESWIIGAPGSKKSFVALDMALHVAVGSPWQGLKVTQADVIIIAAEGAGGMGRRVKAWQEKYGALPGNVRVLPRPVQVKDTAAWAVLVGACARLGAGLIVLDTQARITVGIEENSNTEIGFFVAAVNALKLATTACVLTVHHTGKVGDSARGGSAINGAQDTELLVEKKGALEGVLRSKKQKDMEEREPLPLHFDSVTVGVDEDGDPVTSLVLLPQDDWADASGQRGEQPEEWETGHAKAIVQLFKVLRDQGSEAGLTKAEARAAMVERFYGGQTKALAKSTYYTAWDRALAKRSASEDQVMVNVSGERWTVDLIALETMPAVS